MHLRLTFVQRGSILAVEALMCVFHVTSLDADLPVERGTRVE